MIGSERGNGQKSGDDAGERPGFVELGLIGLITAAFGAFMAHFAVDRLYSSNQVAELLLGCVNICVGLALMAARLASPVVKDVEHAGASARAGVLLPMLRKVAIAVCAVDSVRAVSFIVGLAVGFIWPATAQHMACWMVGDTISAVALPAPGAFTLCAILFSSPIIFPALAIRLYRWRPAAAAAETHDLRGSAGLLLLLRGLLGLLMVGMDTVISCSDQNFSWSNLSRPSANATVDLAMMFLGGAILFGATRFAPHAVIVSACCASVILGFADLLLPQLLWGWKSLDPSWEWRLLDVIGILADVSILGLVLCGYTRRRTGVAQSVCRPSRRSLLIGGGVAAACVLASTAAIFNRRSRLIRTFTAGQKQYRYANSVAFAPDGRSALLGASDGTVVLWDLATGNVIRTFIGHDREVWSVVFIPDGRTALSGSRDTTIKMWDVATGSVIRTFIGHTNSVMSVAVAPDGRTAMSGSADETLKLWDLLTGREISTFSGHAGVLSVAIAPDGRSALSGNWDATLNLWDLATGSVIRTFTGHTSWVSTVAFVPDGRAALSGSKDGTLKLWDFATGSLIRTLAGHVGLVDSVAIAPDGRYALSGGDDWILKLWDLATGSVIRILIGHADWVGSVAIAPDGRRALSSSRDKTIKLWDLT